jgi:hypothetical protein
VAVLQDDLVVRLAEARRRTDSVRAQLEDAAAVRGSERTAAPANPAWRLLVEARAARGYLAATAILGIGTTLLIIAQAGLLARALTGAARGPGLSALAGG